MSVPELSLIDGVAIVFEIVRMRNLTRYDGFTAQTEREGVKTDPLARAASRKREAMVRTGCQMPLHNKTRRPRRRVRRRLRYETITSQCTYTTNKRGEYS